MATLAFSGDGRRTRVRANASASQCGGRSPVVSGHAPPPRSPPYLCERHARSCRHLCSTLVSKLPETTLGVCTLATPGSSRGESDKHGVEERPVLLDNLEQPGFESEYNPPQPVESRQSKVDNLSYLHV